MALEQMCADVDHGGMALRAGSPLFRSGTARRLRPAAADDATPGGTWRRRTAGLALVGAVVAAAHVLHALIPAVGTLLWAMLLGFAAGPAARRWAASGDGIAYSARTLLRGGVALLGLGIAVGELLRLGSTGLIIAVATIAGTMLAGVAVARRLGVRPELALLIGTGSGICGASAVAAMNTVTRARDEDVGYAIAVVTLFGTAAMIGVPLISSEVLGQGADAAGLWAGASIHEVAQVAGAGAALSPAALQVAMLMKLTRVVLLAPTVACVAALSGERRSLLSVPSFVLAFLAFVALRGVVDLPTAAVDAGRIASTILLGAGLAALGLQSDVRRLARAGLRPLLVGATTSLVAAVVSLTLVLTLA